MVEEQKNLGNAETEYKSQKREKGPLAVLESQLKAWVLNLRHSGRRVSTTSIKLKVFLKLNRKKLKIS